MNVIKQYHDMLLQAIDSGRLLYKGMKGFYYFKAFVLFVFPLYLIIRVISDGPTFLFGTYVKHSVWTTICSIIFAVIFIAFVLFLAYINYLFWTNRAKKLDTVVRDGDNIVAIPLVADNIKNNGEMIAIIFGTGAVAWALIRFLYYMLTGDAQFYNGIMWQMHLRDTVIAIVGAIVISFLIIMLFHFISEGIRMVAQMCNDLRDVADIHRAATITDPDNAKGGAADSTLTPQQS